MVCVVERGLSQLSIKTRIETALPRVGLKTAERV